jgi:hypothetical protein
MLASSASAVTISTYPGTTFVNFAWEFGNAGTATGTYGQSFLAPSDTYLVSYTSSFEYLSGDQFKFRLYIAPWDEAASKITGSPIFTSSDLLSATDPKAFKSYTVITNLKLTPGERYIAFYSSTDTNSDKLGSMKMALADYGTDPDHDIDPYTDGAFHYNSASGLADAVTNSWSTRTTKTDTAFSANFGSAPIDTVPEPASMAALGLGVVALVRRRRSR